MRSVSFAAIFVVLAVSLMACVTKTTVVNSSTAQGWGGYGAPPIASVYAPPGAYYGAPVYSPPPPNLPPGAKATQPQ